MFPPSVDSEIRYSTEAAANDVAADQLRSIVSGPRTAADRPAGPAGTTPTTTGGSENVWPAASVATTVAVTRVAPVVGVCGSEPAAPVAVSTVDVSSHATRHEAIGDPVPVGEDRARVNGCPSLTVAGAVAVRAIDGGTVVMAADGADRAPWPPPWSLSAATVNV